jgi:alpha-methylacyl-CoA racemase
MAGALEGITIVEMAGLGPAPFAAMMLADHGATVIRIDRPGAKTGHPRRHPLNRSRRHIEINLKDSAGISRVRELVRVADGVLEGFRPGTMEKLGLGPDVLLGENPKLVYGRMTGWGQEGPYSRAAGHDINYLALAGNLHGYGPAGHRPVPPVNAVADFGGGGMMMAFGMLAGILSAKRTGQGQVIDCAMVDGAALLATTPYANRILGGWRDERGVNLLDGGAPFYDSYETADGRFIAIGSLEPQFYSLLLEKLGLLDDPDFDDQMHTAAWPAMRAKLVAIFASDTRDSWSAKLQGTDICFAPILSLEEAPLHPHNIARKTFIDVNGLVQPAPAPRFDKTPAPAPKG